MPNLADDTNRALDRSEHLVNDGSSECHTDLRAIREAIVALTYEVAELRRVLADGLEVART